MIDNDTIAAISTPPGESGIAVVRVSGKNCMTIAQSVFRREGGGDRFEIRKATHGWVGDGDEIVDETVMTFFEEPHSYTGEDVVEFSCHGSPFIAGRILELLIQKGARQARPGEFTLRAFLNGKMDLIQAEAVADLIHAKTELSRRIAMNQLEGRLSQQIKSMVENLVQLCSLLELELDFSEEDLEFTSRKKLTTHLDSISTQMDAFIAGYNRGRIRREGIRIVIVGKPNVGKSSILNCLVEKERAIVTDIPGTTRDTVEDVLDIGGVLTFITDTAGIRQTSDPIEKEGVRRAEHALEKADIVLLILDRSLALNDNDFSLMEKIEKLKKRFFGIVNKTDLKPAWIAGDLSLDKRSIPVFEISATMKTGILELVQALEKEILSEGNTKKEIFLSNIRHKDCLVQAQKSIVKARNSLENGMSQEFIIMDLRAALDHLAEITGEAVDEGILNRIFSSFCIGK